MANQGRHEPSGSPQGGRSTGNGAPWAVLTIAFLAMTLTALQYAQPADVTDSSSTTITIDGGTIEGATADGVLSFKGVPFAMPPVGDRRWSAPEAPAPWHGVREATTFGHDCMQWPEPGDAARLGATPSEDCLVLNVWRPADLAPGKTLPVMVWIHGGGYVNGGTSSPAYDGSDFARQGIVFVSANYRLGRFGFFAHPALIALTEGPVGNFAYMDQIAALRWVKRNIAAFGGDPSHVTVAGQSAGGDSIMHLLTSPQAKGLFHRAIVMSGDGRTHLLGGYALTGGTPLNPSADQIGVNFAMSVGIMDAGPRGLDALRALPPEKVCGNLNMARLMKLPASPVTYTKGPIVDGQIVSAAPGEVLRRLEAVPVPLMIGTTGRDLPLKYPPSLDNPLSYFGSDADKARAAYDPRSWQDAGRLLMAVSGDLTMQEPARFVARQMTRAGMPVWLYRFDYVAESLRSKTTAAGHSSDLPFLFDSLAARYGSEVTGKDRAMSRAINAYVVNFVKDGDPNGGGLPTWPKFDPARSDLMMFTPDNGPVVAPDPLKERLDLVERAVDASAR